MRVLVCGGRDFDDPITMDAALCSVPLPSLIITGAQRTYDRDKRKWVGADWQAIEWAQRNEVAFLGVPAKWTRDRRAAGPIRNALMLEKYKPEMVVALPGGAVHGWLLLRCRPLLSIRKDRSERISSVSA